MEDVFQRLHRLVSKGAENRVISVERLFYRITQATRKTFPNVCQATVSAEELEATSGYNRSAACDGVVACLHRGRLAKQAYTVKTSGHWLPKIEPGYKTCSAAAYSQQIGLEECLLRCTLDPERGRDGRMAPDSGPAGHGLGDLHFLTRSWACGFVRTVAETAKDVLHPWVLVQEQTASIWLAVASLGRCLLGWPLTVRSEEENFLVPHRPIRLADLQRIIITDPYSIEIAELPVKVDFKCNQVRSIITSQTMVLVLALAFIQGSNVASQIECSKFFRLHNATGRLYRLCTPSQRVGGSRRHRLQAHLAYRSGQVLAGFGDETSLPWLPQDHFDYQFLQG